MEHSKLDVGEFRHFKTEEKIGFINFVTLVGELMYMYYEESMPFYIMASPEATNSSHVHIPQIVYRLISKEPGLIGENTRDYKARVRSVQREISRIDGEEVPVEYKAQAIDAVIRFSIYGDNKETLQWANRLKDIANQIISFFSLHPGQEQPEHLKGIKRITWLSEEDTSHKNEGKHYTIRDVDFLLQYDEITRRETRDLKNIITRINMVTNINEYRQHFERKKQYTHTPQKAISILLRYIDLESVQTFNGKELKESDGDGYLHIGYLDGWDYYLNKEDKIVKHEIGEYTKDIVVKELTDITMVTVADKKDE